MATDDLLAALQGLKYAPIESPYGIAGASIAQSLPQMITPTMSTGKALGLSLGSVLLSGLLGYQARRDAAAANLESAKLGLQLQSAMTPEARLGIIEQAGGGTMGDLQSRLLDYNNILATQELTSKASAAAKKQEFEQQAKLKLLELGYPVAGFESLMGETPTAAPAPQVGTDAITGAPTITIPETIDGRPVTPKEKRQLGMEAAALKMKFEAEAPKRKQEFVDTEYKRLEKPATEYTQVASQFAAAQQLAQQDTIASAQALAKLLVKIPDPTSVVSRAEQNAAGDVQTVRRKYQGLIDQWIAGGSGFDEQAYKDMLNAAKTFVHASGSNYNKIAESSIQRAVKQGVIKDKTQDMSDFLPVPLYNASQLGFGKDTEAAPPLSPVGEKLQAIKNQLQRTTDPAQIEALKQEARRIAGK
jgi:hypothetical protein